MGKGALLNLDTQISNRMANSVDPDEVAHYVRIYTVSMLVCRDERVMLQSEVYKDSD